MPALAAASKTDTPGAIGMWRPLIVRRTGIARGRSPGEGRLELLLHRRGDCLGAAGPLGVLAPMPLGEIVVGPLEPALRRELIDPLHEPRGERHRDLVAAVLGAHLRWNLLPVEDPISRHDGSYPVGDQDRPASRRNRSTAADAFWP